MRSVLGLALITLFGLVMIWPHLFYGYPDGHGARYNVPWLAFFSEQLFRGDFYPRWLVDYPDGLGSPVFYFFGPLPFYLASLIDAVVCIGCTTPQVLSVTNAALFALSGLLFYAWMSRFVDRTASWIGAILYMSLPYHYLDIEVRGAIGESMTFVWLPAIFIALEKMLKAGSASALVALAYAGLILSHLPSALLTAPFMVLYVMARAGFRGMPHAMARLAFGGALGLALAAVYLLPALTLRDLMSPAVWLGDMGKESLPESWLFIGTGVMHGFGLTVYRSLAVVTILAAVVWSLSLFMRHQPYDQKPVRADETMMIAVAFLFIGICWLLMSAPSVWLWSNAHVRRSSFFPLGPGALVDFFSATVIMISAWKIVVWWRYRLARRWKPESRSIAAYLAILLVPSFVSVINLVEYRSIFASQTWIDPSPRELGASTQYQPKPAVESRAFRKGMAEAGTATLRQRHERGYERLRRRLLKRADIALSRNVAPGEAVTIERVGATDFEIDAVLKVPASIVVGRFYFPTWRLVDVKSGREIPIRPSKDTGLITFDLPAGTNWLHLDFRRTELQQYGITLSIIAALLVMVMLIGRFRFRKRPADARL